MNGLTQDIVERLTDAIERPQETFPPNDWAFKAEQLFRDAKREIERLRLAKLPNWAQAALTPESANITIVGNTPTTGGNLTAQQHSDWLATIPDPIEPVR